jgi:hypothetical protein
MISEKKKREYYALAKQIKEGIHTPQKVFEAFERHPDEASEIVNFWLTHDEFTQNVVNFLAIEKLRIKFERCYKKELPIWDLRTIFYGLTRIILKLRKIF